MEHAEFVHLHAHSEYSLLDGACRLTDEKGRPSELLQWAARQKMPAMALTDHGNLFGAIEFYRVASEVGVKPILGCEMYLAPGSRLDRTATRGGEDAFYHFTLLARNEEGYRNLLKLSSIAYREGYYYKPRVDKEVLRRHSRGLVALSGCLKGELAQAVLSGNEALPTQIVEEYRSLFGPEDYYLEIMDHGLTDQKRLNEKLLELSKQTGAPVVVTNDCHYLKKEDAPAHDVLLCIGTGTTLSDPNRLRFQTDEFYYKSPKEMHALFSWCPQGLKATLEIAERCALRIPFDQLLLPHYEVPEGETPESTLEKLCLQGLRRRYGDTWQRMLPRLGYELDVIKRMGFAPYFLIVWDFVEFARREEIPVGPGRGSGAGSLVAYALGITNICPVRYGLLFERFLNPERRTMPDLDIDFSDEGRERVIQYVKSKYGENSVAQIITFGSMLARLVVRDVGRVLGIPLPEVDRIAKLIPRELGTSIASARRDVPELEQETRESPEIARLLDTAQKLEGLKRHTGVHAAGIVIAKGDLTEHVPVARGAKEVTTTQFNDEALLKLGLLKIDFLGLRTLTVIDRAVRLIQEQTGRVLKVDALPLDDGPTYQLLQEARTMGVFQLESAGMRDLLRKLKPTVFEDIIALISLYRPGPMGAGMLDEFVRRKHNPSRISYDHPLLEPILKETYGVILYQEQVMRIATDLAGFPPAKADILRKAMGKKIPEEMERQREDFLKGSRDKGLPHKIAEKIFEQIVHFGGYGFNKSHSTAYGMVAYQTAYLEANYPLEYMTSLLTSEIGRGGVAAEEESKLSVYLTEAQEMGLRVLPPDVQRSFEAFTVENLADPSPSPQAIRFGLLAVKNVGTGAVATIVEARQKGGPFQSLEDLCQRIDLRQANRKVLESLIKAGAMDRLSSEPAIRARATFLSHLETILRRSAKIREEVLVGQGSLFDLQEVTPPLEIGGVSGPAEMEWPEHTLLAHEREVLGFYLSGHPLARYQGELALYATHTLNRLPQGSTAVRLAGMIANVKRLVSKIRREPYARCRFEDLEGEVDLVVFPRSYAGGLSTHLKPGEMVVVTGRVSRRGDDMPPEVIVEDLVPLSEARERFVRRLILRMKTVGLDDDVLKDVRSVLEKHPGSCRVIFEVATPRHGAVEIEADLQVKPTEALLRELENVIGQGNWSLRNN